MPRCSDVDISRGTDFQSSTHEKHRGTEFQSSTHEKHRGTEFQSSTHEKHRGTEFQSSTHEKHRGTEFQSSTHEKHISGNNTRYTCTRQLLLPTLLNFLSFSPSLILRQPRNIKLMLNDLLPLLASEVRLELRQGLGMVSRSLSPAV
ncbi:hypothetical protein RRG08_038508 [Elysia crispata]|uniref:Uncharacterized protein n=1 Tax=Elysia crispata TaxID=231223 RepID=A0AAE1AH13_9GAST|nr:hypothetical protein RRG08_038508 [Elysia crispata]